MIFLRILGKKEAQIEKIAELLLKERLAIDINIKRNVERLTYEGGRIKSVFVHLLTGKTKGLLFPTIDSKLREIYSDQMPEVYSCPIVHMDWEQSELLTEHIQSI